MLSAICLSLDQSKILLSGNGLTNPFTHLIQPLTPPPHVTLPHPSLSGLIPFLSVSLPPPSLSLSLSLSLSQYFACSILYCKFELSYTTDVKVSHLYYEITAM